MIHTFSDIVSDELKTLANTYLGEVHTPHHIGMVFDARHMPCPMPLLKAKISLKTITTGQSLYLLASDKNAQIDLIAFCHKNNLAVHTWQSTTLDGDCQNCDTIFHFIITKNT